MAPDGTSLDERIYSHIPMSGDGSGMGAPAPALAGYSGKVQEQLASLNNCPWCAAKGLTCALRSYRINLHESIILCPSPQCLYPLVSRPLEDVLASLVPPDPQTGTKRKISCGEEEDPVPSSKRPRAEEEEEEDEEEEEEETRLQSGDVTHTGKTQSTDTEVTDKNKHRLLETEVIEGYHKDSDWPVQEETDREVAHGEEATAVSKMAAAMDFLLSPREAVPSSEEAEGKEMALCAPMEAVPSIAATVPSQTEVDSPVLHTTVSSSDEAASTADEAASTADTAASTADEGASTVEEAASTVEEAASITEEAASIADTAASTADEAASTAGEAASTIDEAISAVVEAASTADKTASIADEAASIADEAASPADEAASIADEVEAASIADDAASIADEVEAASIAYEAASIADEVEAASIAYEAASIAHKAASTADEAVSTVEEAASVADKAASTIDEAISAVVEAASIADEALSTRDEAASTVDEAISAVVEAASIADKAGLDEAASTIDEAISAVVEAASTSNKAVSPQAEAVVSSECEEDVLSTGEEVQTEVPLQAMDTPRSTDLRSPGIPNKEEDPPSTTITTPAPDREELAETEQKRCTGEDELKALDNGEQACRALQNWLKSGTKRLKVKPGLNQGPVCSNELVPAPSQLFWRNEHKLCWLDTLMVAMVNCRALRERRPKSRPRHATLWELCETYDQACALLRCYQQHYQDGVVRVPSSLLQMVTERMNMYRMCIVNLLQPKLRFKLGDEETPVFAMPLLLKLDTWAEPQFQLVYRWEFLCCHRKSKNSYVKTLSTFTEVVSDWHPLNAVHQARCGTCRKQVTRMMQLESVPPVFALHFEKGLPCTDVSNYSFSFHDNHYSVTMVIQYLLQKHFVTWIRKPNGSWLEFDDLKHPECLTHNKLTIPAHEMHVVFWERENNGRNLLTCSSSDSFTETGSVVRELDRSLEAKDFFADDEPVSLEAEDLLADEPVSLEAEDFLADESVSLEAKDFLADESVSLEAKNFLADESVSLEAKDFLADESVSLEAKDFLADESVSLEAKDFLADDPVDPLDRSHELSLHVPQDDTAIVEALTVSSDEEVAMDTNVAADSAMLLDAFEGLSHSDIVTLTLVEVNVDPEEKPSDSDGPVSKSGPSSSCEVPPDSSAPDTPPQALETSPESSPETATSKVRRGIIQPSVVSTPSEVSPVEITTPVSSIPSVKPLVKPLSRKKRWPAPLWVTVDPEENPLDSDDPVLVNGLSSSCEVLAHSSAPDTPPQAPETSHESPPEIATSKVRRGIIQPKVHRGIIRPSVVSTPSEVSPVEITTPVSSVPSVKPLAQRRSRKKKGPAPPLVVRVDPEENQLDIDDPVPDIDDPVPENGLSSSCEVLAHSSAPDTQPHAPETSHESSTEMATSKVRRGIILPSVISTPSEVSPVEVTAPVSSIPSVKPLAQRRSRKKKGPAPPLVVRVDPEENQLDIDDPVPDIDDPVPENGLSSSCEVVAHSPAPHTPPHAPATSHESSPEMATSKVCRGIILPSVISTPSEEITTPVSSIPSVKPLAKPFSRTTAEPAPINIEKSGWTYLLNKHPAISSNSTSAPSAQRKPQPPNQSNSIPLRRPQLLKGVRSLRKEDNEALPAKAAEMYGGFPARGANHPTEPKAAAVPHTQSATHKSNRGAAQNGTPKVPLQPRAPFPRNPSINNAAAVSVTRPPPPGVTTELPKISSAKKHGGSHKSKVPPGLDDTGALRYKLLKKLKAKKKRLDELNQRLGFQGDAGGQPPAPKPDSTALDSPYDVSSTTSVYNSPVYDEFFAELLSPTTTASSNLSPDSTGLLLANGQEGGGDTAYAGSPIGGARQENAVTLQLGKPVETPAVDGFMTTTDDNFMDEFISGADMQQQTEMETEELNVLEMFF